MAVREKPKTQLEIDVEKVRASCRAQIETIRLKREKPEPEKIDEIVAPK
jgi:hypothetical protein